MAALWLYSVPMHLYAEELGSSALVLRIEMASRVWEAKSRVLVASRVWRGSEVAYRRLRSADKCIVRFLHLGIIERVGAI